MKNLIIIALIALSAQAVQITTDPLRSAVNKTEAPPAPPAPYQPWQSGMDGYNRVVPDRFLGSGDDTLMRSIIEKYAVETRGMDGKPTGQFFLDKAGASALATEVVGTHLKLQGAELNKYLDENFPKAWAHFDVNQEGKIEASRGPMFARMMVPDVIAGFGLQLSHAPAPKH